MLFPGIYVLCGMFPELLLSERCLYPCTICPVTFHMILSLLAGSPFLGLVSHPWRGWSLLCNALEACRQVGLGCKKQRCQLLWLGAALQPKCSQCFGYFCSFFEPGQLVSALAEKLGKVLLIP